MSKINPEEVVWHVPEGVKRLDIRDARCSCCGGAFQQREKMVIIITKAENHILIYHTECIAIAPKDQWPKSVL